MFWMLWLWLGFAVAGDHPWTPSGGGAAVEVKSMNSAAALASDAGRTMHVFGRNPTCGSSVEDVWVVSSGTYNWLTAAAPLRIRSGGNANDTAAGSGAREITFECLDASMVAFTETVATAGGSASTATSGLCLRLERAYVSSSGTYTNTNAGQVVIETTGGTQVGAISAGLGETQLSMITVPAGYRGYLTAYSVSVDGNKEVTMRMLQRPDAGDTGNPKGHRIVVQLTGIDTFIQKLMGRLRASCRALICGGTARRPLVAST